MKDLLKCEDGEFFTVDPFPLESGDVIYTLRSRYLMYDREKAYKLKKQLNELLSNYKLKIDKKHE